MSTKTVKKEYIILGVVIAALLLYLVLRNPDKVHYQLPQLQPLDGKTLTKIEIAKPGETITLVKKDELWVIDPKGFPTDVSKVKDITDIVTQLNLTALASTAKNYSRYDLGKEKAIGVKAYQGDTAVREFEIGKVTATNNHTFVKIKDDDRVYHAGKSFRRNFDKKVGELRDKVVMKLDKNEISGIEVEKEGTLYSFDKIAKPVKSAQPTAPAAPVTTPPADLQTETIWSMKDGKEGNKTELDSILSQLADLKCDDFVVGKEKTDYKTPVYTLKMKGKKDYVLSIYEKVEIKEKEDAAAVEKYPVVSSESPYPFWLTKYTAERLMKKPEDLLKK